MDFVCELYGNTYAVHVTVAFVGVATLNLALPVPPVYDLWGLNAPLSKIFLHLVSYKVINFRPFFFKI